LHRAYKDHQLVLQHVDITMAPPTTEESDVPVLPVSTEISYLSEGAANIVYRISVPVSTPPPSEIEEYGDDTPPPSEIEVYENGGDVRIFDSKLCWCESWR
jgi:hypothetical protein